MTPLLAMLGLMAVAGVTAQDAAPSLPIWLEVSTMTLSGFFGAVVMANRGAPILGVIIGGLVVGLGGGVVRDVLLNVMPFAISAWYLIPLVAIASLIAGFWKGFFTRTKWPLIMLQALSVGMLVLIGCEKAMNYRVPFWSIVALGLITASAGGATLDALCGMRAALISQGRWHVTAPILGALVFIGLFYTTPLLVAEIGTVVIIVGLRMLSHLLNWDCPTFPEPGRK